MSQTARIYLAGKVPEDVARNAVRRDAKRPEKSKRPPPWMMNAYQRRSELQRLAWYRRAGNYAKGSDAGWANAIANLCRVMNGFVTEEMVVAEWAEYNLGPLPFDVVKDAVAHHSTRVWGTPKLFSAAHVGSLLEMTSVERAEARIEKIDACDETGAERKRRQDRERKARKRAAQAALAPKPETKAQMAERMGISRMELYRRIKAGEV